MVYRTLAGLQDNTMGRNMVSRVLELFASLLVPARLREEFVGDLLEEWATKVVPRHGTGHSLIWLFYQLLLSLVPMMFLRLRESLEFKIGASVSLLLGCCFAYVDTRPTWDDSGIMAGLLVISSSCIAFSRPERPWVVAFCMGLWIPTFHILLGHGYDTLIVVIFPLAGAYLGNIGRRSMPPSRCQGYT